jgi:hypothetical protein
VLHCLDCGQCLGFNMMPDAESPRTLFEVLFTRWQPSAPSVIVYDNSCHGHVYCLNREPEWCKDSVFAIDKVHYKGHVGCSAGYDISSYPGLAHYNSSMAEQRVR